MNLPTLLESALTSGRLSHAYLFYGRTPESFRPVVVSFFQRLACPEGDGRACGSCADCRQVESMVHPDVTAPGLSEGDETPGRLTVDLVRDRVLEAASLTPARSEFKLFWLHNPARFTREASNTLLKVLEDPPGQSLFVLTARSRWDCLPTVRSRCQWIRFAPDREVSEDPGQHLKQYWPDRPLDEERRQDWLELLKGNRTSYDYSWSREDAELFLGHLLVLIHHRYRYPDSDVLAKTDSLTYRLVDPILERFSELENNTNPDLIINSLLEDIFIPGADSSWQNVI